MLIRGKPGIRANQNQTAAATTTITATKTVSCSSSLKPTPHEALQSLVPGCENLQLAMRWICRFAVSCSRSLKSTPHEALQSIPSPWLWEPAVGSMLDLQLCSQLQTLSKVYVTRGFAITSPRLWQPAVGSMLDLQVCSQLQPLSKVYATCGFAVPSPWLWEPAVGHALDLQVCSQLQPLSKVYATRGFAVPSPWLWQPAISHALDLQLCTSCDDATQCWPHPWHLTDQMFTPGHSKGHHFDFYFALDRWNGVLRIDGFMLREWGSSVSPCHVTKPNERTEDLFESKNLPFCLTFF